MTNLEERKVKREGTLKKRAQEVQEMKNNLVDRKAYELIRMGYLLPDSDPGISTYLHRVITGEAVRLVWFMMKNRADEEELVKAVYYLCICEDAFKHRLDYIRYRKDHGIEQLSEKYGIKLATWKKVS